MTEGNRKEAPPIKLKVKDADNSIRRGWGSALQTTSSMTKSGASDCNAKTGNYSITIHEKASGTRTAATCELFSNHGRHNKLARPSEPGRKQDIPA